VNKQQLTLAGSGLILLLALLFFGRTTPGKKPGMADVAQTQPADSSHFNFPSVLATAKQRLNAAQTDYVNRIEASVTRGDVKNQQLKAYQQLAKFWYDTARVFEPYIYYTMEAAKLENSEKSLTFAANLILRNLRTNLAPDVRVWLANNARELFEKALTINPASDSSKVGLGSAYIFGSSASTPNQTMQGIQQVLEVARRDSTNMYAQLMLGIGGIYSGQYDKAIERLKKVTTAEPQNAEAWFMLAEAYEHTGNNAAAIACYENIKRIINNEDATQEIDQRINLLKQNG
jgi:tetratricopeptide (TPR) repeat protein